MNVRIEGEDKSILDISIPTVIFNYEQEVSGAHIDFELEDVDEVSNPIKILHNVAENELLPQLEQFLGSIGVNAYKLLAANLNSMHRHPGGRNQAFSGTDYQKNPNADTGIVFPLAQGEEKPNFASIIAHVNGKTFLAHNEYRLANGDATTEKGTIKYTKGRCVGFVKAPIHHVSDIEKLFGYKDKEQAYVVADNLRVDDSPLFTEIEKWWNGVTFQPNVDFVKAENLSQKVYKTTFNYNKPSAKGIPQQTTIDYNTEVKEDGFTFIKVKEYAKENYQLDLFGFNDIEAMTQEEMNDFHFNLEVYYYNLEKEYTKEALITNNLEVLELLGVTTKDVTIEEVVEILLDVIEELSSFMEEEQPANIDIKRNELIGLGAYPQHVGAASDEHIIQWHMEIFGEVSY